MRRLVRSPQSQARHGGTVELAESVKVARRLVEVLASERTSAIDRVRMARQRHEPTPPSALRPAAVDDPAAALHRLLRADFPCAACTQFSTVGRQELMARLERVGAKPHGPHDGGALLLEVLWTCTSHVRPDTAVETGVARGLSSATMLAAMEANGSGRLYSIDLPAIRSEWFEGSKVAVPPEARHRWTYIRRSAERELPRLIGRLGGIDLFVHDSLHTYGHMSFEFEHAWEALRPGGVLVTDDVFDNRAFDDLVARLPDGTPWLVAAEPVKGGGGVGVVRKPSMEPGS